MNFHTLSVEYMMIGMAIIILYLIYHVFSKDSECHKNIHAVASVIEEMNRELYFLKGKLNDERTGMSDDEIHEEIEKSVYDMVQPLSMGLKKMQENIQALDTQMELRISSLENGTKYTPPPHEDDDDMIISLFTQGISIDDISKELHVSKPEVELVLKINKIQ